jgi:ATP-dependent exoDNAse (exonuclease V) beta subunit
MNPVSEEQQNILNVIAKGHNVVVDACAGSGKSTTILSTAISQPDKHFLLITYNKSLRKEIQEKIRELKISNVIVHTYHSLAVAIYNTEAYNDKVMRLLVQQNTPPKRLIPAHVLVLDEVQDMTFLYFRLVVKYLIDLKTPLQLMVLGDYMQGLYEFKGADIRFLTKAIHIWQNSPLLKSPIFISCSLHTSYRITKPMADFVNDVLLGDQRLLAVKQGEPVVYIRRSIRDLERFVVTTIRDLIQKGASPSDFFILGGSVKGPNSPIRRIENALVAVSIPCHVPMMENSEQIDEDVIKGKIVFSSFHTSKGRQRPFVFIVGFDHSYFKTIARTLDPTVCPNTLYVATTRASTRLFLLESDEYASDRPLKFLRLTHHEMARKSYVDFRGIPRSKFEEEPPESTTETLYHRVTPTDLTKFVPESVLEDITALLDSLFIKESAETEELFLLPSMVQTKSGFYEDVSDLNGIAIPALLYDYISALYDTDEDSDKGILYRMIRENLSQTKPNKHLFLKQQPLIQECESIHDYLYMANVLQSAQEKLYFRLKQIERDEYTWLTPFYLAKCKQRMMQVLEKEIKSGEPKMEHVIVSYDDDFINECLNASLSPFMNTKFIFSARVDLLSSHTLWELKCTSEITAEHMIQTVIYAWIMRTSNTKFSQSVKIFNIKTGQVLRLEASNEQLIEIVVALLKGKYERLPPANEADFLNDCRTTLSL